MAVLNRNIQYQIATAGAAMLAGMAVKALLTASWRGYTKKDPPQNPEKIHVNWSEAIAWTIASSVVVGVAGLIARRGVANFFPDMDMSDEPLV